MTTDRPLGMLLVLGFVLLSAFNGVYLSRFLNQIDPFAALFLVFALIAGCFNLVRLLRRRRASEPAWGRTIWRTIGWVNLTTAGNWFGFFFAVKYLEPALCATLINAVLPLVTIAIAFAWFGRRRVTAGELLSALGLLLSLLGAASVILSGQSARAASAPLAPVIGLLTALLCSVSIAFNTVVSKRLNTLGVSPSAIMAHRFWLLLLLSLSLVDPPQLVLATQRFAAEIVLVALLGNLAPLFALQHGIKLLNPVTVVFLNGFGPLAHLLIQTLGGFYPLSPASAASIGLATVAILFGAYFSSRASPAHAAPSAPQGPLPGPATEAPHAG